MATQTDEFYNKANDGAATPVGPHPAETTTGVAATAVPSHDNDNDNDSEAAAASQGIHILEAKSTHWWSYLTTPDFWFVIAIGQVLALCITGTNTFSSLLAGAGTSIPAFQTVFNYILLFLIYTTVFIVRDGPAGWWRAAKSDGWKYLIMSFMDVEGNYFTVLAYRYTNVMSAQLINFWAIVVVVIISFFLLRVRYRLFQIIGILICCGGMGILIGSDHLQGSNGGPGVDLVKGDLFALLGASLYGLSNVLEEFLVSKAPMYQFLSFIGLFGACINGVQAAIFDRQSFRDATWNGDIAGWLVGYTLILCTFYSLVPVLLRTGSAAILNISLLTGNFWGVIIGIKVFHLKVHFLYPIAFVCIIIGITTYFLSGDVLGDARKPWLGENQERGVAGFGTAKRKAIKAAQKAQAEPETGMVEERSQ
ncbi:solute carrier family 35 member [Paramyrothecium foliicola]|nr:solute carrier family 35 member [Paramyrothecium foliicola]